MRMETFYVVKAETEEAIKRFADFWSVDEIEDNSFEAYDTDIFDVMKRVIQLIHIGKGNNSNDSFSIAGALDSDYDCTIFTIDYSGSDPLIKVSLADPEDDEELYGKYYNAEYDEIPSLLEQIEGMTFKEAVENDLPLGAILQIPYDDWVSSIISKMS